jgi:hypothetical protein
MSCSYKAPKFIPQDGRDMIAYIFNVNPAKRPGVAELRAHRWMKKVD